MKLSVTIILLCICQLANTQGIDVRFNPSAFSTHPRILLTGEDEAEIKYRVQSDKRWSKVHSGLISECEKIISLPELERIQTGRRLLDVSREAFRRIFYLSYAYRMTGESKFKEKAEREMLAISAFSDWNPSHFLDVAEMTLALSIGYDWLYNNLSEQSKRTISNAIVEKGLKPSLEGTHTWLSGNSNWNQVCNTGMTFGAIAVYESHRELSEMIIERSIHSIAKPMQSYAPDGAYPEGYTYWNYGTTFNVLFLSAIEKLFNTDFNLSKNQGFLESATYMLNMVGPTRERFNYGDCGDPISPSPAMFWFAKKTNDSSIVWNQKYFIDNIPTSNYMDNRFLPAIIIWGHSLDLESISTPSNHLWVGQGATPVALMRSSWTDPNAIFVGLKAGRAGSSHSHMDVGSFIVEMDNVRWGLDLGIQDYHSLESKGLDLWNRKQDSDRWNIFRYNNFSHNTLIINNQKQNVKGYALIDRHGKRANLTYAISDLSKVYDKQLRKIERGVAIVNDKVVVVQDEIESLDNETTIRWNMITSASAKIIDKNTFILTKGDKSMTIKVEGSTSVKLRQWSTTSNNDYDAPNTGTVAVGFEADIPANTKAVFKVEMYTDIMAGKEKQGITELKYWQ